MAKALATVTEYIKSFGAFSQMDEEDETCWMSEYDAKKDVVTDDSVSESTDAGSSDGSSAHRSRSGLPTSISKDDFWQFYRRLSDIQSQSQLNVCPEGISSIAQKTQVSDECSQSECSKLLLKSLPDEAGKNLSLKKPKQNKKSPAAPARRGCLGRKWRMFGGSSANAQDADQMFSILAEQIY
jgi:hypothetical protein